MFAALAVMKADSIQIALCHLLFNIIGILIWFPAPPMRRVIIHAACTLGFYASYWRFVPLIYILVMFLAVPGVTLAISLLYQASVAGGIVVTILALGVVAGLAVSLTDLARLVCFLVCSWLFFVPSTRSHVALCKGRISLSQVWWWRVGCYKVVSQEERELRRAQVEEQVEEPKQMEEPQPSEPAESAV